MKKILLIALSILIITTLAGCGTYEPKPQTAFNLASTKLLINKTEDNLLFQVIENGYTVEAEECILRNDNTHEIYSNFGDYGSIIYTLSEDGYYTFGFYKDDIEIIYNFKLSELKETQTINY